MRQSVRWFGPLDHVSVDYMLQAGVQGVVSALRYVPTGEVWELAETAQRQEEIGRRAGRWGEAEDIGGTVVFLASSAARYVHGAVIPVDGGWLAR